jgi:hypothetical protein
MGSKSMFEYTSWGVFILSFLLCYSILTKTFLSREERELISRLFGSSKKNSSKKNKLPKKNKNKKRKKKIKNTTDSDIQIASSAEYNDNNLAEDIEEEPEGDHKEATLSLMNFLQASMQHLVSNNINLGASDRFGG